MCDIYCLAYHEQRHLLSKVSVFSLVSGRVSWPEATQTMDSISLRTGFILGAEERGAQPGKQWRQVCPCTLSIIYNG